jgi:putative glycosyltransferase (TIGR04372 family)
MDDVPRDGSQPQRKTLMRSWRHLKQRRLWLHLFGRSLLLVDLKSCEYGHFAYELMMAAKDAADQGIPLYTFNSLPSPNEGLFRLKSIHSKLIASSPGRDLLAKTFWTFLYPLSPDWEEVRKRLVHGLRDVSAKLREENDRLAEQTTASAAKRKTAAMLSGAAAGELLSEGFRRVKIRMLKRKRQRIKTKLRDLFNSFAADGKSASPQVSSPQQETENFEFFAYLARSRITNKPDFVLSEEDKRECRRQAETLGIAPEAAVVVLHVRESGYKAGREIEYKPGATREDVVRNADITTYFPAIDRLIGKGCLVVRVGDSSMRPVAHRGVVDLATSPQRSGLLELYFLSSARFLLASESGPYHVSYLFGTPTLLVNATDVIGAYPIRTFDRYIFKRVRRRADQHLLSFQQLIGSDHYNHFRDTDYFDYIDNSSEEILEAVDEMLDVLAGAGEVYREQEEVRQRILKASHELAAKIHYIRRWGADMGVIGNGHICRAFAQRLLSGAQ